MCGFGCGFATKVCDHYFIAQEKWCSSLKEEMLLPVLSGGRIINVFLGGLCVVLFASFVSLQAMKAWQKVATVPWSQCHFWLCCQRIVFHKVNSSAIDQRLELLRKEKYFTGHQRKLICYFEPSVEMLYTWADPGTKVSVQRASASRSTSLTPAESSGCEAEGKQVRNQSPVLMASSSFTYCFIGATQTSLVNVGRAQFVYF